MKRLAIQLTSLAAAGGIAAPVMGADGFPRGPGNYFDWWSFGAVVLVYLVWVYTTAWIDADAKQHHLDRTAWGAAMLASGVVGMLLFWLIPPFLLAFLFLLASVAAPYVSYVLVRNPQVDKSQRLWTERHLKKLLGRFLQLRFEADPEDLPPPPGPAIKYLRKSTEAEGSEPPRIRKAREHRGAAEAATLLVNAIERRASDLVAEPASGGWAVKYWIDGVAHPAEGLSRSAGEAAIQVFKLLAELVAAEKRKPQEGSFGVELDGTRYEVRVHTAGTVAGEKLTLRIHERALKFRLVAELGLPERAEQQVTAALQADRGLFLVCGPRGSGVTQTAYSLLMSCDRFQRLIVSIEDPIEQRLPNIDQVPLDRRAGDNFASTLRKVLVRYETHVIYVSELRDKETADLVCQKAAESHLMITSVQAADAVAGLFKLVEMGISQPRLAKVLLGVLSPRLIRVLCPDCKVKYRPNPEMVRRANLPVDRVKHLCRPPEPSEVPRDEEGQAMTCEKCHGIGYYGRVAVFEYLHVSERIRQLLQENAGLNAVKQEAIRGGMPFVQDEAMKLVVDGITSIPEILRVLG